MTSEAILPFSPLRRDEEAIIDAYVNKKPVTDYLNRVLGELGVKEHDDLRLPAIDVAAAKIIGQYAGGDELPNYLIFNVGGRVHYTRETNEEARRSRRLFSLKVVSINWATSGPGFDWPDQYRVTWLPNQSCWVLTSALDCDDMWGITDLPLGRLACGKSEIAKKAARLILRHWKRLRDNFAQEAWESLRGEGLIDSGTAWDWRERVWPEERSDDDEE